MDENKPKEAAVRVLIAIAVFGILAACWASGIVSGDAEQTLKASLEDPPTSLFIMSRDTGVAPLAVHFDATELWDETPAGVQPFYDYAYEWDFGDPGKGRWKYGNGAALPATSKSGDKNFAFGAIAAHVYEPDDWKDAETDPTREFAVTLRVTTYDHDTDPPTSKTYEQQQIVEVVNPRVVYPGHQTVAISNQSNFAGADPAWLHVAATGPNDWAIVRQHLRSSTAVRPVRVLLQQGETWVVDRTHQFDSTNVGGTLGVFGIGYTAKAIRVPQIGESADPIWVASVDDGIDYDPTKWVELSPR